MTLSTKASLPKRQLKWTSVSARLLMVVVVMLVRAYIQCQCRANSKTMAIIYGKLWNQQKHLCKCVSVVFFWLFSFVIEVELSSELQHTHTFMSNEIVNEKNRHLVGGVCVSMERVQFKQKDKCNVKNYYWWWSTENNAQRQCSSSKQCCEWEKKKHLFQHLFIKSLRSNMHPKTHLLTVDVNTNISTAKLSVTANANSLFIYVFFIRFFLFTVTKWGQRRICHECYL